MAIDTGIVTQGDLKAALAGSGNEYRRVELCIDGPVAYFSRVGGRFIGVFPGRDSDASNTLWLPSDYAEMLKDPQGWNIGGDRLWAGPEFSLEEETGNVTYFCQEPGNYGRWVCQNAMDPGSYSIEDSHSVPGGVILKNAGKIRNFAYRNDHEFGFFRFFDPTKQPTNPPKGTTCAGVDFIDKVVSGDDEGYFHAWKLVQVFPGLESAPGTVIFPSDYNNPVLAVYMNKTGEDLGKYVQVMDDHISVRTQQMIDRRFKLAIPPGDARKIAENGLEYHSTVMHIAKVPDSGDRYQLTVLRSLTHPGKEPDILEVSSVSESDMAGLPPHLQGGRRGGCFVYNGPSPDGQTCFTELELTGPCAKARDSTILGNLTFAWGDGDAVLDAAKQFGGLEHHPHVYGLNE